ncbi:hypothetical protein L1887_53610 [Cichorium endivia]|nr:hypothetical protein L1887_53610 [Cichorium endivia]
MLSRACRDEEPAEITKRLLVSLQGCGVRAGKEDRDAFVEQHVCINATKFEGLRRLFRSIGEVVSPAGGNRKGGCRQDDAADGGQGGSKAAMKEHGAGGKG